MPYFSDGKPPNKQSALKGWDSKLSLGNVVLVPEPSYLVVEKDMVVFIKAGEAKALKEKIAEWKHEGYKVVYEYLGPGEKPTYFEGSQFLPPSPPTGNYGTPGPAGPPPTKPEDIILFADIKHLLPEGTTWYDACKLIPKLTGTMKQPSPEFYNSALGEPFLPDELGEAGPSEGVHIPDPLQSMQEQAEQYKSESVVDIFHSGKGKEKKKNQQLLNAFPTEYKNLPPGLEHMQAKGPAPKRPEPRDEMPAKYDAEKVFDILHDVALDLAMEAVDEGFQSNEEYLLRKVSDSIAEMIVAERETVREFKRETEKWSKNVSENMAQMSLQLHDLTNDLKDARDEVIRLETENRSLRVSGTLNKLPRKVRNSG